MGYKDLAFGKLHNFLRHFVKLGRIAHHIIGNAGQVRNKVRYGPLWIDERMIFIGDLMAIVNENGDLRDSILGWLATRSFNINNSVQRKCGLFQGKYN